MEEIENTVFVSWQRIVDARLADVDQLPYRISTSILADFELTSSLDGVKNFLWKHIAVLTSPQAKIRERRTSLDAIEAFLASIDRATAAVAAAAPIVVVEQDDGSKNSAGGSSKKPTEEEVDTREQSASRPPSGTTTAAATTKENVTNDNDIHYDTITLPAVSTATSDRTERERETDHETNPANPRQNFTGSVDQAAQHVDSEEEPRPENEVPTNSVVLGPKCIIVGPAYDDDNNQSEGNAFCWQTVTNHAAEFFQAKTAVAKLDVCWKVYSHLTDLGFHFFRRESATSSAHLRMMQEDKILKMLENALSWNAQNLAVVESREQQSTEPVVEGEQRPPSTPCTLDPAGSQQQNPPTKLLSSSQVTKYDVLMASGYKSQGYVYYRQQYSIHRQRGYDEISSSSIAISRVLLNGGRFLTPAAATGELWREVEKAELLDDIRKKKGMASRTEPIQPETRQADEHKTGSNHKQQRTKSNDHPSSNQKRKRTRLKLPNRKRGGANYKMWGSDTNECGLNPDIKHDPFAHSIPELQGAIATEEQIAADNNNKDHPPKRQRTNNYHDKDYENDSTNANDNDYHDNNITGKMWGPNTLCKHEDHAHLPPIRNHQWKDCIYNPSNPSYCGFGSRAEKHSNSNNQRNNHIDDDGTNDNDYHDNKNTGKMWGPNTLCKHEDHANLPPNRNHQWKDCIYNPSNPSYCGFRSRAEKRSATALYYPLYNVHSSTFDTHPSPHWICHPVHSDQHPTSIPATASEHGYPVIHSNVFTSMEAIHLGI